MCQRFEVMKILLAPFLLAVSLPAFAEVDPEIHKLCIEAKDYSGCVRSMKGETSTETTINQIQRQGANLTEGNNCPAGHAYSGGGYCYRVVCLKSGLFGYVNDPELAGKGISCRGGAESHWDQKSQPIRASFDKNCPSIELGIGLQSTCQMRSTKQQTNTSYRQPKSKTNPKYFIGNSCVVRPSGCKTLDCLERLPSESCRK